MNHKCTSRWALLAVLVFCLTASGAIARDDIVVARVTERPPSYWLQDGQWVGMDMDFYRAMEKASGLVFTFVDLPWPRALHNIKNGTCTVISQLSRNAEREQFIHFLGPYNSEEMVMMVPRKNAAVPIENLQQLAEVSKQRGVPIGISHGVYYGKVFEKTFNSDPEFRAHFKYVGATIAEMMRRDRLFGMIDQRVALSLRIRTQPEFKQFTIHPFVIHKDPIYFGVSKHVSAEILKKLRQACSTLMQDGTFAAIEAKWKNP